MQFGLYTIQLPKKDVLALVSVIGSSQYFPVLDCVSYSWTRKTSCLSLRLGLAVSIVQFGLYIVQTARRTSWLSLWLGLAVSIFQCLIVYRTECKKDFVGLVMVRVSSQYFPVLDCISYSTQDRCPGSR